MHDRRPIRELRAAGRPIRAISRDLGISRNTVRRALDLSRRSAYVPGSQLDDVEPDIRVVLTDYPHMPATGVARRLRWDGSMSGFTDRVRLMRREVLHGTSRVPGARPQADLA